ncbi:MAG: CinA family nicotinamide mononucleotide deamidase-related protein [Bacteroidales bacterium]
MDSEIIVIGDELLIGQVTDTNSGFIARKMNEIGVDVCRVVTVRDREEEITAAISEAMSRVDLVLVTGGLGPTNDDITKSTLCNLFGGKLIFSSETQAANDHLFSMRGKDMNDLTRSQAMLPDVCTIIPNELGTAPAMLFNRGQKLLISMPGVPFEMCNIVEKSIISIIKENFTDRGNILHITRLVCGITESQLAEYLSEYENSLPKEIKLAYLPNMGIIRLRLTAHGTNQDQVSVNLCHYAEKLDHLLGGYLLAKEDMHPAGALGLLLKERGLTISTAESCTGGNIAAQITSISGASEYFKGGIVTYHNSTKISRLSVKEEDIRTYGVVSNAVVEQMARGAAVNFGTNCAIATSGIAGPGGGSKTKPVGTVAVSVYYNGEHITQTLSFPPSDRIKNIDRFTSTAITMMINMLKGEK